MLSLDTNIPSSSIHKLTITENLWSKENHTENTKIENAKEKEESVKTEQTVKTNFFEALPRLKSKIARIIKVSYTYKDHTQFFEIISIFFRIMANKMVTGKSG